MAKVITEEELEEKISYRLLHVVQIIFWIIIVAISGLVFFVSKPSDLSDLSKSIFSCPNGNSYSMGTFGKSTTYSKSNVALSNEDHITAMKTCNLLSELNFDRAGAKAAGYTDQEIQTYLSQRGAGQFKQETEQTRLKPPYTIKWKAYSEESGEWFSSLKYTAIAFIVSSVVLLGLLSGISYVVLGGYRLIPNQEHKE